MYRHPPPPPKKCLQKEKEDANIKFKMTVVFRYLSIALLHEVDNVNIKVIKIYYSRVSCV